MHLWLDEPLQALGDVGDVRLEVVQGGLLGRVILLLLLFELHLPPPSLLSDGLLEALLGGCGHRVAVLLALDQGG